MQAGILQHCNRRVGRKKRSYSTRTVPAKPFGVGLLKRSAAKLLEIPILSIKNFDPFSTKVC
jgi:hypothetical protein